MLINLTGDCDLNAAKSQAMSSKGE